MERCKLIGKRKFYYVVKREFKTGEALNPASTEIFQREKRFVAR
jgi:hypothetical protein